MIKQHHYILHKPYGFLSQFVNNQTRRRNKKLLGELYDFAPGTMAIGRLDQDSEGLLLLTTDGKVSAQVLSRQVEKEYYVQVDGLITDEAIEQLKTGVEISIYGKKYETLPCGVFRLNEVPVLPSGKRQIRDERHGPTSWVSITLTEGKFRQIRKMTAAVGFPTLRLVRIRVGNIKLGNLAPGETIEVNLFRFIDGADNTNPDSLADDQN